MITPDPLTNFLFWFLDSPIGLIKPPDPVAGKACNTLTVHESVLTLTLFRNPPFQVELVILLPGSPAWPGEHRHPNVDSYEVAWFNTVNFTKNGKVQNGPELIVPVRVADTQFTLCGAVRLLPTDFHGTNQLVEGGALISLQHWLNGVEPTSVGNDWIGAPTTPGHAKLLEERGNSALPMPENVLPFVDLK